MPSTATNRNGALKPRDKPSDRGEIVGETEAFLWLLVSPSTVLQTHACTHAQTHTHTQIRGWNERERKRKGERAEPTTKIKWHRANARVRADQRGFTIFANIASNRPSPTTIYFVLLPALVLSARPCPFVFSFLGAIRRHPLIPIDENKDKLIKKEKERERKGNASRDGYSR